MFGVPALSFIRTESAHCPRPPRTRFRRKGMVAKAARPHETRNERNNAPDIAANPKRDCEHPQPLTRTPDLTLYLHHRIMPYEYERERGTPLSCSAQWRKGGAKWNDG